MMTVTTATPAYARPKLDVGQSFKGGWNAFTADVVPLLVATLVAGLLSVVTLGILAGPLVAGLYSMVVGRMRDGRPAHIGDVFSCMDRFWAFLWAAIVLVVLIGLASLTIVGGVLLATVWIYVFPFMVDRRMGLTDAMSASYHQVVDNGFWEHLALIVIFAAMGAVANGWVGIVTTPFTIAVITAAYFVAGGRGDLIEHPPAPPAPPAPTASAYAGPPAPQPTPPAPPAEPAATAVVEAPAEPVATAVEAPAETAETAVAQTEATTEIDAEAPAEATTAISAEAATDASADAGTTEAEAAAGATEPPATPEQPAEPAPEA